ncbi:MAG: ATP-dependent helicase, partial [Cyanobacteria bacterium J06628_6]
MPRKPTLRFDRGTLILHPPPRGKGWIDYATWDDRIERFRIPAHQYRPLVEALRQEQTSFEDSATAFEPLTLTSELVLTPYPHQQEALAAWTQSGRAGVVVLPTA